MKQDKSPRRWHANPDPILRDSGDTVAKHSKRVATLCHSLAAAMAYPLTGSSPIDAALSHDDAEAIVGDMPAPAKQRWPDLANLLAEKEREVLAEMGKLYDLPPKEAEILDFCDKADNWLYPTALGSKGPEWDEALLNIHRKASRLGPDAMAWLQEKVRYARA